MMTGTVSKRSPDPDRRSLLLPSGATLSVAAALLEGLGEGNLIAQALALFGAAAALAAWILVTSIPSLSSRRARGRATELWSMEVVMTWSPHLSNPAIARLRAAVVLGVKTIRELSLAPMRDASASLVSKRTFSLRTPAPPLPGVDGNSVAAHTIRSTT